MQYDTLLLDNDGVLLEYGLYRRERFHEEMRSILDEYEVEYTGDDVDAFTGWTERDTVERFCDEQGV
ncbi:MAG: hypothetical protein SVU32_00195, partial [Candidatus Nanohaloarchaea archaeon]|nr:hypothetical protein [Candidatus Nanohaloarchaea archaeon]